MLPEECDSCFADVQHKIDVLVNNAKNAIIKMNNDHADSINDRKQKSEEFFEQQARKYNEFLDRSDKRENRKLNYNVLILGLFAMVIGYSYIKQDKLEDEILLKANKKEVPTLNEIKQLRDLGDQYNRSVFVKKYKITTDTSAYYWSKKNIYGSELRGVKTINN